MSPSPRVSKSDSADLAFAWRCLLSGAVTFDEFKTWAEHVVTELPEDALPPHMIEIMMAEQRVEVTAHLPRLIGFVPSDPSAEQPGERAALWGITAKRGTYRPDDAQISSDAACRALAARPQVAERFRQTFPFLEWQEVA